MALAMPIDIPWYLGLLLFVSTILAMEVVAINRHKHAMHGFGWGLRLRSHCSGGRAGRLGRKSGERETSRRYVPMGMAMPQK